MRRGWLGVAVVALLVGGTAAVVHRNDDTGGHALPVLGPARDMYDGDLGDPYVLPLPPAQGGGYIAFGTGDRPARVPTAHSTDLIRWEQGPDAMPNLPAWASPDPARSLSWAPAGLATTDGFVLYLSLREERSQRECIAAATSSTPEGPYVDRSDGPLLCQRELGGSIDPSIVRDRAGGLHLLWKSDGNCCSLPSALWEQNLDPGGLSVSGEPHKLLTVTSPWQGGIVEEPTLVAASDGGWWLFYSGNRFDSAEYATGVAYCRGMEGPCQDRSARPFPLQTSPGQHSPGGLETFRDAGGTLWAVYDTWNRPARNGRFYCCRSLDIAPVLSV